MQAQPTGSLLTTWRSRGCLRRMRWTSQIWNHPIMHIFQDLMSGSEYWNLHLIVINSNSVSHQINSVAGIKCCNNFQLIWALSANEFAPEVRQGFWAQVQIMAFTLLPCRAKWWKSTYSPNFHIEHIINDKSLQQCLLGLFLTLSPFGPRPAVLKPRLQTFWQKLGGNEGFSRFCRVSLSTILALRVN